MFLFYYKIGLIKLPPIANGNGKPKLKMCLSWNYDFVFTNLSKNQADKLCHQNKKNFKIKTKPSPLSHEQIITRMRSLNRFTNSKNKSWLTKRFSFPRGERK